MPHPVLPGAEPWSSPGRGDAADVGVVLLHGFTGNPVSLRPFAEAIAAHGYTVELPLLPGHGTHWRDLARTRYRDWRGAARQAAHDLAARCRTIVLVGLSMGGTLVLDLAAEWSGGGGPPLAGVAVINALVLPRPDPLARVAPLLQYVIPVVPPQLAGIAKNDIARGGDERAYPLVPSRSGYSLSRELPRIRAGLGDIEVPVFVAYSAQDHTVHPSNGPAIAEAVGSDDVTLLELERSFHLATLDHDADLLADEIAAFTARIATR